MGFIDWFPFSYPEDGEFQECVELKIKKIIYEKEKSWLIQLKNGTQVWFPKSVCEIEDSIIYIPEWLYDKKIEEGEL